MSNLPSVPTTSSSRNTQEHQHAESLRLQSCISLKFTTSKGPHLTKSHSSGFQWAGLSRLFQLLRLFRYLRRGSLQNFTNMPIVPSTMNGTAHANLPKPLSPHMERYLQEVDERKRFLAGRCPPSADEESSRPIVTDWDSSWRMMEQGQRRTERLITIRPS